MPPINQKSTPYHFEVDPSSWDGFWDLGGQCDLMDSTIKSELYPSASNRSWDCLKSILVAGVALLDFIEGLGEQIDLIEQGT